MVSLPNDKRGKLRMLRHADLLYIRVGVLHWLERCTLLRLLQPSCPVVWEINGIAEEILGGPSPSDHARRLLQRDLRRKRWMARLVDAAVCVSDMLAVYATERYGIRRTLVAPNGGDPTARHPDGGETVLADLNDRFVVLWAGSANIPWQGLDQILEAARRCERIAPDVLFALVLGGRGDMNLNLPHRRNTMMIHRTDRVTVGRYIADADCVAVVYTSCGWRPVDGSSLKLFEAMAAGKPVIATALGQTNDVVRDGVDGLLIPQDPDALVQAILRLRDDALLRSRLATSARERIESAYTWRHTVDRVEPLLQELVAPRPKLTAGFRGASVNEVV